MYAFLVVDLRIGAVFANSKLLQFGVHCGSIEVDVFCLCVGLRDVDLLAPAALSHLHQPEPLSPPQPLMNSPEMLKTMGRFLLRSLRIAGSSLVIVKLLRNDWIDQRGELLLSPCPLSVVPLQFTPPGRPTD